MAEHGEWNRKGAVLSDVTAKKEYGVSQEFVVQGIREGKLEFREGSVWGNPYLRVLRSQLENYIVESLGGDYLITKKSSAELRAVNNEISKIRKRLTELEARKVELQRALQTS